LLNKLKVNNNPTESAQCLLSCSWRCLSMKLTNHSPLSTELRIHWDLPPLSLYIVLAWYLGTRWLIMNDMKLIIIFLIERYWNLMQSLIPTRFLLWLKLNWEERNSNNSVCFRDFIMFYLSFLSGLSCNTNILTWFCHYIWVAICGDAFCDIHRRKTLYSKIKCFLWRHVNLCGVWLQYFS
jgi:hypothetical protein